MSRFVDDNVRSDVGKRGSCYLCLSSATSQIEGVFALETIYTIWAVNAMMRDF